MISLNAVGIFNSTSPWVNVNTSASRGSPDPYHSTLDSLNPPKIKSFQQKSRLLLTSKANWCNVPTMMKNSIIWNRNHEDPGQPLLLVTVPLVCLVLPWRDLENRNTRTSPPNISQILLRGVRSILDKNILPGCHRPQRWCLSRCLW